MAYTGQSSLSFYPLLPCLLNQRVEGVPREAEFAECTSDLVPPLSPQAQTSASSSPCCALLMTSVTGCARPMEKHAQGLAASTTPASGSSEPSLRRHRSPTRKACYCAHASLATWAAGSADATPSPPAAHCHLGPPTAWS